VIILQSAGATGKSIAKEQFPDWNSLGRGREPDVLRGP